MSTLIVAAHPDDEVLGCGGLIAKEAKQEDFYVLILTGGAVGRYSNDMEKTLRENALAANEILGTKKVFFEDLPNQGLETIPLLKITQTIEKYMKELAIIKVYTHHGGDLNKDHKIVFEATMTATRPVVGQMVKEVYTYNVPSSTEWNFIAGQDVFIPNFFVDIKDTIEKKQKAMASYDSECRTYPHPRSVEAVKAHGNYWGLTIGVEYAEPFTLVRKIEY